MLFIFVTDRLINQAFNPFNRSLIKPTFQVTDLGYADDILLLRETPLSQEPTIDTSACVAASVNLVVNVQKTKIFTTHTGSAQTLYLNVHDVELVPQIRHLSSNIHPIGQAKDKITQWI